MQLQRPQLDALDFTERYAWFTYDPTHPALGSSASFEVDKRLTEFWDYARRLIPSQPRSENRAAC